MKLYCIITAIALFGIGSLVAQPLSGTKTIPGDYASIRLAVIALNTNGVTSPGVTFNIASGYLENINLGTAPIILNTNTGSASSPIVFQKVAGGAVNPVISAGTGGWGENTNAGITIAGTDYITIDGIDVQAFDNSLEFGYSLLKKSNTAPFDGCQNIIIRNCKITLNKTNSYAVGIYTGNHIYTSTNALTITSTTDAHNNCKFYSNTIISANTGISLNGYSASSPYSLYDQNNEVGVDGGNSISDYGNSYSPAGIYANYQQNLNVSNNTITSGLTAISSISMYGVGLGSATGASATISNNTITITCAGATNLYGIYCGFGSSGNSNTINISNNTIQNSTYTSINSAAFFGICNGNSSNTNLPTTMNIFNNTIHDLSSNSTGYLYGIDAGSATNLNVYNNQIYNIIKSADAYLYGLYIRTGIIGILNNVIHNLTITTGTGKLYGIYDAAYPTNENFNGNTIYNLNHNSNGDVYGLYLNTTTGTRNVSANIFHSFVSAGGVVTGMYHIYSTPYIYNNTIYDLSSTTATGIVNGIQIDGGTNPVVSNNYISDLRAPNSTNVNAVRGIMKESGNTTYLTYNTIYLNATSTSTTTFGTSGIYANTNSAIELKNNIVVNNSVPVSVTAPAYTVAYRRSAASITVSNYLTTSNNNCFYAGTPGPTNLIFYDGTNADQSVALFKVRVTPREANSFSELPPFVNPAAQNFHLLTSVATNAESGGSRFTSPIAVTTDFDNTIRWGETGYTGSGTSTDVGADENNFTPMPAMTFQTSTTTQQTGFVFSGNTNQPVIRIKITVNGGPTPLSATQFALNANGTTGIGDINTAPAKIYYTGNSAYYGPGIFFGTATPTLANFNINGTQQLSSGDNYFWLVYDIKQTAITGNFIDGECTGIVISGINQTPVVTAPAGSRTIYGPMSGEYMVGAGYTYPNFSTLTDAVTHLNNRGVGGPVTLTLTNGSETPYNTSNGEVFPITINEIPLSSSLNTVLLRVATGKNPVISGNSLSSVFFLNGTDYFTIDGSGSVSGARNLTVANTNGSNNTAALHISTGTSNLGANYNTVKSCIFSGGAGTPWNYNTYAVTVGAAIGTYGAGNDYLTLQNNEMSKAYWGLYVAGSSSNPTDNLNIRQNTIGSDVPENFNRYIGAYFNTCSGVFSDNEIKGVLATDNAAYNSYGLYINHAVKDMVFTKNRIYDIGSPGISKSGVGIAVDAGSASLTNTIICNNTIYNIFGSGSSNIGSYGIVGIRITNYTSNLKVYYNSVYLNGVFSNSLATSDKSAAMYVGSLASQLDIRNNIFVNTLENSTGIAKAYAFYAECSASALSGLDYNDYYTSGMESVLAYMGNDISTLAGLKVATGRDANSISAWPDYNGTTCLVPYAGSPVTDVCPALVITDDFNGIARTVPASMGAYEVPGDFTSPVITYDPLDNTNFTGSRTLDAVINDYHGSVPVSGLGAPRLYWRFGNGAWNIVTSDWVGGNTFRFTFGAGAVLGNTVSYFIVAQDNENTANCGAFPSSGAAGFGINPPSCSTAPSNPSTYTIVNGIAGIKNIPGDYSNLTGINGLFADINSKVLTGPLTVNIGGNLAEDGSVALNEINVTDTAFHLCIQVPGNTYRVISGGYSGGLIRFNGADGVSLKGNGKLKIVNTNTTPSIIISLSNGSNSNVIEGCKLVCGSSYMSSTNSGIMLSGANSNNIIRNDTINKCYNAVYLDGTYWNQSSNNKVYSNTLGSAVTSDYIYQIGIAAFYQDQLLIKGNEIFNVISNNSPKAIYTEGLTNSTIEKNNIHDIYYNGTSYGGASGITIKALNNNPNVLIKNNLIRKISGMGSSPNISDENSIPAGIKLFGNATSGINVYNNSVYMIPDPVYGLFYNNEWFTAVEIGAGVSGINMADNILQNSVGERTGANLTSYGYAVYCKSTVSPFATINNNIYYTTGFDNNFVGLYGTAVPPVNNMNLASWKTFTGQDTQSLNIDPAFTSLTSLVPLPASPAIGSGLPLPGIVDEDYLANPRGNPTTIGAYELVSASSKTLNLTLFLEGLYAGSEIMYQAADENGPHFTAGIADQISVELHSTANYASKLFTATGINLSTLGHAQLTTPAGMSGNYYVTIRHRNSIETVSAVPVSFSGTNISYNFTGDASAAYGNNMKDLGEGLYGIFGGDSNNDGAVDALDLILIDNDASGFISGYTTTDLNGDGVVDALDLIMADNNASQFISLITP